MTYTEKLKGMTVTEIAEEVAAYNQRMECMTKKLSVLTAIDASQLSITMSLLHARELVRLGAAMSAISKDLGYIHFELSDRYNDIVRGSLSALGVSS